MLPLMLRLADRLCVVVGGGAVGQRRAQSLLDAGALVLQVALEPCPVPKPRLSWHREAYRSSHLAGAHLVCAAATPVVNQHVVTDARARGQWVNSASDPAASDFHFPACIRRGPLVVGLSSGGLAPAFTRSLRERLEKSLNDEHGIWLELLGEVRPWIVRNIPDAAILWQDLTQPEWLTLVREQGRDAARTRLWDHLHTLAKPGPNPL